MAGSASTQSVSDVQADSYLSSSNLIENPYKRLTDLIYFILIPIYVREEEANTLLNTLITLNPETRLGEIVNENGDTLFEYMYYFLRNVDDNFRNLVDYNSLSYITRYLTEISDNTDDYDNITLSMSGLYNIIIKEGTKKLLMKSAATSQMIDYYLNNINRLSVSEKIYLFDGIISRFIGSIEEGETLLTEDYFRRVVNTLMSTENYNVIEILSRVCILMTIAKNISNNRVLKVFRIFIEIDNASEQRVSRLTTYYYDEQTQTAKPILYSVLLSSYNTLLETETIKEIVRMLLREGFMLYDILISTTRPALDRRRSNNSFDSDDSDDSVDSYDSFNSFDSHYYDNDDNVPVTYKVYAPIYGAIYSGNLEILEFLLENGIVIDDEEYIYGVIKNHHEMIVPQLNEENRLELFKFMINNFTSDKKRFIKEILTEVIKNCRELILNYILDLIPEDINPSNAYQLKDTLFSSIITDAYSMCYQMIPRLKEKFKELCILGYFPMDNIRDIDEKLLKQNIFHDILYVLVRGRRNIQVIVNKILTTLDAIDYIDTPINNRNETLYASLLRMDQETNNMFNIKVYSKLIDILRKKKTNPLIVDTDNIVPHLRSQQLGMRFGRALQINRNKNWERRSNIIRWRHNLDNQNGNNIVQINNQGDEQYNEESRFIDYIKQIDNINKEKPLTEERRTDIKRSLYGFYPLSQEENETVEEAEMRRNDILEELVPLTEFGLISFGLRGGKHERNFYKILNFYDDFIDNELQTFEQKIDRFIDNVNSGRNHNHNIYDRQGNPIRLIAMDYLRLHSEPEDSSDYYNPYKSVMTGRARKTKKLKGKQNKGKKMLKTKKKKMRKNKKRMKLTKTRKNKSKKNVKKTLKSR
jgi:hypothetical protein